MKETKKKRNKKEWQKLAIGAIGNENWTEPFSGGFSRKPPNLVVAGHSIPHSLLTSKKTQPPPPAGFGFWLGELNPRCLLMGSDSLTSKPPNPIN